MTGEVLFEFNFVSFLDAFSKIVAFQWEKMPWTPKESSNLTTKLDMPFSMALRRQELIEEESLNLVPLEKRSFSIGDPL